MAYGDAPASPYAAALRAGSPAIFNHVAGRLAAINQERLRHVGQARAFALARQPFQYPQAFGQSAVHI